jgi:AsmA protein
MKKIIRWISLLFVLALLCVGGVIVFVLTLDPNNYRDEISSLAAEQGIHLDIRGDLDWKFYPELLLSVNDAQVQVQSGTTQIEAEVQRFGLALKLLPLPKRRIEFIGLSISGADVLVRQLGGNAEEQGSPDQNASESPTASLPDIFFEQLDVSDSRVELISPQSEPFVITDFNAQSQNANTGAASFPLQASFNVGPNNAFELAEPVQLDTELSISSEALHMALNELSFSLLQDTSVIPISATGDLDLNFIDQQVAVTSLLMKVSDLELSWKLQGQLEPLLLGGSVQSNVFSPANMLEFAGITLHTSDASVLAFAQIGFDLEISDKLVQLNQLEIRLDDSNLQGQLALQTLEIPNISVTANLDSIDIDRYLPPQTDDQPTVSEPSQSAIPAHLGKFEFSVGQLKVKNQTFANLHSRTSSSEKQISLDTLTGEIAGGGFNATAKIGLDSQNGNHQLALVAKDIFIDQVLTAMSGEAAPLTGRLSANFSATSTGRPSDFLRNILGNGSIDAESLVLVGIDVEGRICDISDRLQRQSLLSNYGAFADNTLLNDMNAVIDVDGGLAKLTGLEAGIGNIQATATGQLNLESTDFRATINATIASEKTSEAGCTVNQYLRNRILPLTCSGTLNGSGPQCGIDQAFVQDTIQQAITQSLTSRILGIDSDEDESESKPIEQQLLEGLFNRLNR